MAFHQAIQVIIADDHSIFRLGLKTIFKRLERDGFSLIGEAANGTELIGLLKRKHADVVLMDVEMPEMNGIEATIRVKKEYPLVRTIALSFADNRTSVLQMINAGADGYLLKNTGTEELAQAVSSVHQGYSYFSPAIHLHLAGQIRNNKLSTEQNKEKNLTKRELEILKLICDGESSKEIASSLYISKRTVDTFRENIMKKAGVKNMLQLLRYAIKNYLIEN